MASQEASVRHPLTRALASAGLGPVDVASRLGVDPKTVQRWLGGRVPLPRYRKALSGLTGWTAADLWPEAAPRQTESATDDIRITYAHRSLVPSDTWRSLIQRAGRGIDVLAYSALFLFEDPVVVRTLAEKARGGVVVRIALGDPTSPHVAARGVEEGLGDVMAARIRNSLVLLRPFMKVPGVEVRLHDTVLYNSVYRADNELLVNPHIHGVPAARAPVLRLRTGQPDRMAQGYVNAFKRIWSEGRSISYAATCTG
jgi:hypothetical protein